MPTRDDPPEYQHPDEGELDGTALEILERLDDRRHGCSCIGYQPQGSGPWFRLENPSCPVHGGD